MERRFWISSRLLKWTDPAAFIYSAATLQVGVSYERLRLCTDALPSVIVKDWFASSCRGIILLFLIAVFTACSPGRSTKPPGANAAPQGALPEIRFTIQVGAFSTVERAARYAERLGAAGLDAYHFIDRDGLSKVRIEQFASKTEARRRATVLQSRGLIDDFYVVRPGGADHGAPHREARQQDVVRTAQRFIGVPYRWGGTSARSGFDCSGLTMTVYRLNGLDLPRSARAQFRTGKSVARSDIRQGDLVFFATARGSRVSHVGIYAGGDKFIHAPGRGKSIRTASLDNVYFRSRYKGARRYF